MPFVKELCKCLKHCGSNGDVDWEQKSLPQCYRKKIAVGSRGSHAKGEPSN